MKKIFIIVPFLFLTFQVFAQQKTNLIFFTENGERFTVILNGIRQNPQAETNVKVTDLVAPYYKAKIIFEDTKLGEIDKNLMYKQGTETTFNIRKNNKGEYVIRWMNDVPIEEARPASTGQTVVVYTTTPPPPAATITQTQTTTTTVSSQGAPPSTGTVNMGVNINDPNSGVNFNMNINTPGATTSSSSQTTTTYSTTTTTSGTTDAPPQHTHSIPPDQPVYILPGYSGPTGCPYPMSPGDFTRVKQSIESKKFEDSKLTIAKQVINTNCLLSAQVKEIMMLFNFEDTRLELAKYAYGYTYDIGNYYQLNDAFKFESSIDELNEYTSSFKR
ncbi:MAG: DUF4476 domain-containing protein [Bacteroidetes bacterium]|nr:DUF4476 domain-containing protein [Bacteroidota bacterium]